MKERSRFKKTVKIIAVTLAVLIAIYSAAYLIVTIATGDSLPTPFGFASAVVLTGSMEPTLSANDLIFVSSRDRYGVGDIIVFSNGGTPVVHRIISVDEERGMAVTKGDANNVADEPIPLGRIKGKLLFSIPKVGVIPRFVRTVPGMIIVLTLLLVLLYLSKRSRAKDAEEQEKKEQLKAEIDTLKETTGGSDALSAEERRSELEREIAELKKKLGEPPENDQEDGARDK